MIQAAGKASNGGNGREFDYRAIVEWHFGKHTGLRHSAKACPHRHDGDGKPAARLVQARSRPFKQRHGARRAFRANPGESPWEFR
jgi:hypothetical protein